MYCSNCGAEATEGATFCDQCGAKLEAQTPSDQITINVNPSPQPMVEPIKPLDASGQTLALVAFIFNIIATCSWGFLIFPLCWQIPMTVMSYQIWKGTRQLTTGFAVCDLIFVSPVSGILLLIAAPKD